MFSIRGAIPCIRNGYGKRVGATSGGRTTATVISVTSTRSTAREPALSSPIAKERVRRDAHNPTINARSTRTRDQVT